MTLESQQGSRLKAVLGVFFRVKVARSVGFRVEFRVDFLGLGLGL